MFNVFVFPSDYFLVCVCFEIKNIPKNCYFYILRDKATFYSQKINEKHLFVI